MTVPADAIDVALHSITRAESRPEAIFLPGPGVFSVPSSSKPGAAHQVVIDVRTPGTGPQRIVFFSCSCPSGQHRVEYPIPCWHAAAAARRLVTMIPAFAYRGHTGFVYPTDHARGAEQ